MTNESTVVYGTWILKSIYPTQNVEGPSPSQQEKLLGTTIVLDANTLKGVWPVGAGQYHQVNQISSTDFLDNTRVRFTEVGVKTPSMTEVVINDRHSGTCFDAFPLPGQDIYIKDKNEILVYFEGMFYRRFAKALESGGWDEICPRFQVRPTRIYLKPMPSWRTLAICFLALIRAVQQTRRIPENMSG